MTWLDTSNVSVKYYCNKHGCVFHLKLSVKLQCCSFNHLNAVDYSCNNCQHLVLLLGPWAWCICVLAHCCPCLLTGWIRRCPSCIIQFQFTGRHCPSSGLQLMSLAGLLGPVAAPRICLACGGGACRRNPRPRAMLSYQGKNRTEVRGHLESTEAAIFSSCALITQGPGRHRL